MLTKRRVLIGKLEAVEGVKETLQASDGKIIAIDPKVAPDIKMTPRTGVMATLSRLADVPGSQMGRITFSVEIKGPGSAYAANNLPALDPYLKACGVAATLDVTPGAENVIYKPASSGVPSITLGCYEDGVLKELFGARGNAKFLNKAGMPSYLEFDFLGVWGGVTDVVLPTITPEGTVPPTFLNANLTVAAYAAILENISFDMANVLAIRPNPSSTTGYLSTVITGRDPNGSFDPEMVAVATYDFYGKWKAGTPGALNIGPIGGTQYNKVQITAPKLFKRKVADGDREGISIADSQFQLAMDAGDDEFVIKFT